MDQPTRILYCHCAYAQVVPKSTKDAVLKELTESGVEFEAVPDLCEMSARKDPRLKELAAGAVKIAACYPRAVRWLFAAGGAPLPETGVEVANMRTQPAGQVTQAVLGPGFQKKSDGNGQAKARAETLAQTSLKPGQWKPWFPVIDYSRCTNCMQCLSFCLFDVYGVSADHKIQVRNENNCKTDCPACSRVCPEVAILFPKYKSGPINGDEISADDLRREAMKVDISALLGGDIYAQLRDRSEKAKSRFSKERDSDKALKERQRCLSTLVKDLDIPPEVLSALPSMEQIAAKAAEAKARAAAALGE